VELVDSNIVLLGGFNPHIIEPTWLSRHDVVEENADEFAREILFSPGAQQQMMRFHLDGLRWEVALDRILIGSSEARSPAPWFVNLLQLLPHTPIRAVGINFKLQSERGEWPADVPSLPHQEAAGSLIGEVITSTAMTRGRLDDGTQVNLTLKATQTEVVLDANFHRSIESIGDRTAADAAREKMSEFERDWARLRDIVLKMTGEEVA